MKAQLVLKVGLLHQIKFAQTVAGCLTTPLKTQMICQLVRLQIQRSLQDRLKLFLLMTSKFNSQHLKQLQIFQLKKTRVQLTRCSFMVSLTKSINFQKWNQLLTIFHKKFALLIQTSLLAPLLKLFSCQNTLKHGINL